MLKAHHLYKHADGGRYRIRDADLLLKCPESGKWFEAVSYYDVDANTRQFFVRSYNSFLKRFTPMPEED